MCIRDSNLNLTDVGGVSYEMPASVDAALSEFAACVQTATSLSTPEMVPDPVVREIALNALLANCDEIKALAESIIANEERIDVAQAQIDAMTAGLISGARKEAGL